LILYSCYKKIITNKKESLIVEHVLDQFFFCKENDHQNTALVNPIILSIMLFLCEQCSKSFCSEATSC
jgi:hypothetical protein